jgi:hypothetical protein
MLRGLGIVVLVLGLAAPGAASAGTSAPHGGLDYSTFVGGAGEDTGNNVAVDSRGNAYVTGSTSSSDFPTTPGAFDATFNGGFWDVFVTKLNRGGSSVVYSTFVGSLRADWGENIAVDPAGHAYVTGAAGDGSFPTTPGAFDRTYDGTTDTFVLALDPSGSALVYSTFLGGAAQDRPQGLAVDRDGNAYVSGWTESATFPTTAGAFDPSFNGRSDAFVTKLDPTGSSLVYSTFLGGHAREGAHGEEGPGLALGSSGDAYVAGWTTSNDFPTTAGAYDRRYGGRTDGFVSRLNAAGSDLVYSTYLGGGEPDGAGAVAVDTEGAAYAVGLTYSRGFPTGRHAWARCTGQIDGFVTKLAAAGDALAYSTCLGAAGKDVPLAVVVGPGGNAIVTGWAWGTFPTTPDAFDREIDIWDGFVTKLTADGTGLVYSSYVGANGQENSNGVAVDRRGDVYLTGFTEARDFRTTRHAFDRTFNGGGRDAFVAKIRLGD